MSVRPIDQTSMVNKTQETSANRQSEISKSEHISYHKTLELKKNILESQQAVTETNQAEGTIIKEDAESSKHRNSEDREKENSEKNTEYVLNEKEDIKKEVLEEYKGHKGNSLDIKI